MFNYCIPSIDKLKEFCKSSDEFGQITLNSRIFPSRRNTLTHLEQIPDKSIIVHYDYIYIISRYLFLSFGVQQAILEEIYSLLSSPKVRGIIMHTDFPFRKEVVENPKKDIVDKFYSKSLYNKDAIYPYLNNICILDLLEDSVLAFYDDFVIKSGNKEIYSKIYLENTTKIYSQFINHGTLDNVVKLLETHPKLKTLFGICIDTEHDYAATGRYVTNFKPYLNLGTDIIIHLNTIPKAVKPKLCLDRHSETTIFECSLNKPDTYLEIADTYKEVDIIREVNYKTMQRELKQIAKYEGSKV